MRSVLDSRWVEEGQQKTIFVLEAAERCHAFEDVWVNITFALDGICLEGSGTAVIHSRAGLPLCT